MRIRGNLKLAVLLAVALALALLVQAAPSTTILADWPPSCRFFGEVVLCCQSVPPGTVVTVSLDPDPGVGPSWTTTTRWRSGRQEYVIDIPPHDPSVPQEGGVPGQPVYFSITYQDTVITQVIQGPSSTWRRFGFVHHPLRLGTLGDANLDGVIDDADIEKVDRIRRGQDPATPCADVNQDSVVDAADRRLIRWIIDGLIEPPHC